MSLQRLAELQKKRRGWCRSLSTSYNLTSQPLLKENPQNLDPVQKLGGITPHKSQFFAKDKEDRLAPQFINQLSSHI